MDQRIEALAAQLEGIATAMQALSESDQRISQTVNWQSPNVSPRQLNLLAACMAENIRDNDIAELDDYTAQVIEEVSAVLAAFATESMPNVYAAPGPGSIVTIATFSYVSMMLSSVLGWSPASPGALPSALARKLAKIDRELSTIMPDKSDIEAKMATILQANDAAEELPTTLQELKAAQQELRAISSTASETIGKIKQDHETGVTAVTKLKASKEEADTLVQQVAEAYRITTTVGLAASFESRADRLNWSVYFWVGCLVAALIGAVAVGYFRLQEMRDALSASPFDAGRVWVQVIISLVGIAAPVWFAWIATKQIGQRFRLAEDYAFKASVAKAYEGYRREAVRIDPEFEKALFQSALNRLDEAPLRLVELPSHGSPFHEFANSKLALSIFDRKRQKPAPDRPNSQEEAEAEPAA